MLIFERKVEKMSWDGLAWSLLTPIVFGGKASLPSLLSPSILCLVDHHHTLVKQQYLADAVAVGLRPSTLLGSCIVLPREVVVLP